MESSTKPVAMMPVVVLAIGMLAMAGAAGRAEIVDRVLAVVRGTVITQSDVMAARDLGLVAVPPDGDVERAVLVLLIDRQLILTEVDRYAPPEPQAADIDRLVQALRSRFPSESGYATVLARSGVDEKSLRLIVRDDLRIKAYLDQRFGVPPPSDPELARYLEEHRQEFSRDGSVPPLDTIRDEVASALVARERRRLVDEWVAGLRRRAEVTDLSLTRRSRP